MNLTDTVKLVAERQRTQLQVNVWGTKGEYVPVEWQSTVEELRAISARVLRLALISGLVMLVAVGSKHHLFARAI